MNAVRWLIASPLLLSLLATGAAPPPAGYVVRTSFALTPERDGIGGRIELLEDARIRPAMREQIAQAYGADPCLGDSRDTVLRPLCAAPRRRPLRPALLRVVDSTGRVVASRRQERQLAELKVAHLYGDSRPTYLLTVDQFLGVGSYRGYSTTFAEVRDGKLVWLTARPAGRRDRAVVSDFLSDDPQIVLVHAVIFRPGAKQNAHRLRRVRSGARKERRNFPARTGRRHRRIEPRNFRRLKRVGK